MNKERLVATIKAMTVTASDQTAAKAVELYPTWAEGLTVAIGDRLQFGGKLYKVIQSHTTQADWKPDATPALWIVIDVEHAGTLEDPIPASSGMEYTKGLYYVEDGVIYLMNRQGMNDGETIVLHYLPSQLVGQYFVEV